MRKWITMMLLITLAVSVSAKQSPVQESELEKHVSKLTEELRCLVCQNQTIADSHSGLAIDLRNQVREKISAGATDEEVKEYMVSRYGDFVLYRPPVKQTTWLLWFGPFLLLALGLMFLLKRLIQLKRQMTFEYSGQSDQIAEEFKAQRMIAAEMLIDTSNKNLTSSKE